MAHLVLQALNSLGVQSVTNGFWYHAVMVCVCRVGCHGNSLQSWVSTRLPLWLITRQTTQGMLVARAKALKKLGKAN